MDAMKRLSDYYKQSNGDMIQFIDILKSHGYREGFNGYETVGSECVRVYVGAPDQYVGFGFRKEK